MNTAAPPVLLGFAVDVKSGNIFVKFFPAGEVVAVSVVLASGQGLTEQFRLALKKQNRKAAETLVDQAFRQGKCSIVTENPFSSSEEDDCS